LSSNSSRPHFIGGLVLILTISAVAILWVMWGYITKTVKIHYKDLKNLFIALLFIIFGLIMIYGLLAQKSKR